MRWFAITIALSLIFAGAAGAATPLKSVGPFGPHNPLHGGRTVVFDQEPDLNGLIGSSEIISSLGLESEIANDFSVDAGTTIQCAVAWGGYYNNQNGCADNEVSTFRAKFYDDGGCVPNALLNQFQGLATIVNVGCEGGVYPIYQVGLSVSQNVAAGNLYWMGFQAGDHAFPPQWGRLAAPSTILCDSMFLSVIFGFPNWTDCASVFGVAYDASQQFDDLIGGNCGGIGDPVKSTSWGSIKGLYR